MEESAEAVVAKRAAERRKERRAEEPRECTNRRDSDEEANRKPKGRVPPEGGVRAREGAVRWLPDKADQRHPSLPFGATRPR